MKLRSQHSVSLGIFPNNGTVISMAFFPGSRVAGRTSEYVSDVLGSMENSEKDLDSDGSESD